MLDVDERDVRRKIRTAIDAAGRAMQRGGMSTPPRLKELEGVAGAKAMLDLLEAEVARYVDLARAAGATWSEIGAQWGVTKQAAYDRFGRRT